MNFLINLPTRAQAPTSFGANTQLLNRLSGSQISLYALSAPAHLGNGELQSLTMPRGIPRNAGHRISPTRKVQRMYAWIVRFESQAGVSFALVLIGYPGSLVAVELSYAWRTRAQDDLADEALGW